MVSCHVDHIAVTAASLEEGAEFVVQALGVRPQPGGEHERMGTQSQKVTVGEQEQKSAAFTYGTPRAPA